MEMNASSWATQSAASEPGEAAAAALDALEADIPSLRHAASQLVLHYRACASDVIPSRRDEINTFYADAIFPIVLSRGTPPTLSRERGPDERFVGCCRDSTLLFLSMARYKNIPARARVGFAAYLHDGWMADHVVAEVWDDAEQRWRLVDAEMPQSFVKTVGSHTVNWLDLRPDIDFQTGAEAWAAVRGKTGTADRYVVAPALQVPALRGHAYIAHNVIHDLAFMNKKEILNWDCWGPELAYMDGNVPESHFALLDEVSGLLLSRDAEPGAIAELMSRGALRLPPVVTRFDPNDGTALTPKQADISRVAAS